MGRKKVLFICIHNSGRSQIAEAYLKTFAPERYEVESAGLEPGILNPAVVEIMRDDGIDISGNKTKSVEDIMAGGKTFDFIIAVCDGASALRCPVLPGTVNNLHWAFDDPQQVTGSMEEKMKKTRIIRDQIKNRIERWVQKGE